MGLYGRGLFFLSGTEGPLLESTQRKGNTMAFGAYVIGFIIVIVGFVYGAHLLHVAPRWIAVATIILLGIGIVTGSKMIRE